MLILNEDFYPTLDISRIFPQKRDFLWNFFILSRKTCLTFGDFVKKIFSFIWKCSRYFRSNHNLHSCAIDTVSRHNTINNLNHWNRREKREIRAAAVHNVSNNLLTSVADPWHFGTDPFHIRIWFRGSVHMTNGDSDPDPAQDSGIFISDHQDGN